MATKIPLEKFTMHESLICDASDLSDIENGGDDEIIVVVPATISCEADPGVLFWFEGKPAHEIRFRKLRTETNEGDICAWHYMVLPGQGYPDLRVVIFND